MADDKALNFRDEARANAAELFSGPGEVRSHARELDWSKSPLGPTTGWSPEEVDAWMTASPEEALKLQRPLPDGSLRTVACSVKEDPAGPAA